MRMKAERVFEIAKEACGEEVIRIEGHHKGMVFVTIKDNSYSNRLDLGGSCSIMWPDASKTFPIEKKFLPVPKWLKDWTPTTPIMRDHISIGLCMTFLSHIDAGRFMGMDGVSWEMIYEYTPRLLGSQHYRGISGVMVSDLQKMNPEELQHIPGLYYKS